LFTKSHSISRFCFLVDKLSMLVVAASWVWGEMLRNIYIYLVLFIKNRIVFSILWLMKILTFFSFFYVCICFLLIWIALTCIRCVDGWCLLQLVLYHSF
jgi:hypothetical protein